jgi:ribulose-phosphate 3-epimerase
MNKENSTGAVEIIPAVFSGDAAEVQRRLQLTQAWAAHVHLDVADKRFVNTVGFGEPREIARWTNPRRLEVHLMVKDVARHVNAWVEIRPYRIIFHREALLNPLPVLQSIPRPTLAGLAINPETDLAAVADLIDELDYLLILAVPPGRSGQKFRGEVLEKIRVARALFPELIIGVDGGVTLENAPLLARLGVNVITTASAIFAAGNPRTNYEKMQEVVATVEAKRGEENSLASSAARFSALKP